MEMSDKSKAQRKSVSPVVIRKKNLFKPKAEILQALIKRKNRIMFLADNPIHAKRPCLDNTISIEIDSEEDALESTNESNDNEPGLFEATASTCLAVVTENVFDDAPMVLNNPTATAGLLDEPRVKNRKIASDIAANNLELMEAIGHSTNSADNPEQMDYQEHPTYSAVGALNLPEYEEFEKENAVNEEVAEEKDRTRSMRSRPCVVEIERDLVTESMDKCMSKHITLPEQTDEGLIQAGDTFSSIEELLDYAASYAPKWFFYYHVYNSRNTKSSPKYDSNKPIIYYLNCRFNKKFYKSQSKGIRKVKKSNKICPASLTLKCAPRDDKFVVSYSCHHHSHDLSPTLFGKEPHGYRLPKELKDEIKYLAWYQLDTRLIKLYVEDIVGLDIGTTVKNIAAAIKRKDLPVDVPSEKVPKILKKIKDIKARFEIPKRVYNRKSALQLSKDWQEEDTDSEDDEENVMNRSRVETRLDNIQYDQELIHSVKELQDNTGVVIETNPWVNNDEVDYLQGVSLESESNQSNNKNEETECEIVIDPEVYNMEDTIQYVIPANYDGSNILGIGGGERILYVQQTTSETVAPNARPFVGETIICDDETDEETDEVNQLWCTQARGTSNGRHENGDTGDDSVANTGNGSYNVPVEVHLNNDLTSSETEEPTSDMNAQNEGKNHQDTCEYSEDENAYQQMYQYTNDEENKINDVEENNTYKCMRKVIYKTYECRDVQSQADLPPIELKEEYNKMKELESAIIQNNISFTKYCQSSRSQPKHILEEVIINRFNIELYINQCGVTTCLTNLATNMGISELALLKQLYQGEAVLKMTVGRCGNQNRKTFHLAHIPLTIAFPFEKFKFINCLQEYKGICSKYAEVAIKLEDCVQSISKAFEEQKREYENILRSQNSTNLELNDLKEKHDSLRKKNVFCEELLKQKQIDLDAANNQNGILTQKVKDLAELVVTAKKNAEKSKQQERNKILEENMTLISLKQIELDASNKQNEILSQKVQHLENLIIKSRIDSEILKRQEIVKILEENKTLKNKINEFNTISLKEVDLAAANSQNEILTKKVKDLEDLLTSSRRDAEILKQSLKPTIEQQEIDKILEENKKLKNITKESRSVSLIQVDLGIARNRNEQLSKTVKSLENLVVKSRNEAEILRRTLKQMNEQEGKSQYAEEKKALINKIKELNENCRKLSSRVSLLEETLALAEWNGGAITLDKELEEYKNSISELVGSKEDLLKCSKLLGCAESKCKALQKEVNDLKATLRCAQVKIKSLDVACLKLVKPLNETKKVHGTRSKQKID